MSFAGDVGHLEDTAERLGSVDCCVRDAGKNYYLILELVGGMGIQNREILGGNLSMALPPSSNMYLKGEGNTMYWV